MNEEKIVAIPMFVPQTLFEKMERAARKRGMLVPVFIATLIDEAIVDEAIKQDESEDEKTSRRR